LGSLPVELPGDLGSRVTLRKLTDGKHAANIADDVRAGLDATPKLLPPKYFYDERGSWLFEKICATPEYYLTRTENALLAAVGSRVIEQVRPRSIIELGSGSSTKTNHMLQACAVQQCYARYVPFDVCMEMLVHAAQQLLHRYDWLEIDALIGDYWHDLERFPETESPRLFLFLGSTIGNFDEHEAVAFLRALRAVMDDTDRILLGLDRVKDVKVLHAAYNDAAGFTAEFNRNVLKVINRELQADFEPARFDHCAWYNEPCARIEMHLQSRVAQTAHIDALAMTARFHEGESILTEISRKFTPAAVDTLLAQGGFAAEQHFAPENAYFSLVLARPAA
jgi:L-histidine Nalpha-methyltransferase